MNVDHYILKYRWLLLAAFPLAYALTYSRFEYSGWNYSLYALAVFMAFGSLLYFLRGKESDNPAIWLIILIFLATYVLRFPWLSIDPTSVQPMLHYPVYVNMKKSHSLLEGYKNFAIFFSMFCLTASLLLYIYSKKEGSEYSVVRPDSVELYSLVVKLLLFITPLMAISLSVVAHKYHIGVMGVDPGDPLPFRLKGVIFYARLVLVPLMILLLIYASHRSDNRWAAIFGVSLFVVHSIVDMYIRSSRSPLLLCVLLLVLFVVSRGMRLRRNEQVIGSMSLVAAIFLVPVITNYRFLRVSQNSDVIDAMLLSLNTAIQQIPQTFMSGIEFVLFRMPGVESIAAIIGMKTDPLYIRAADIIMEKQGLAGHLTHNIYLIPETTQSLSAPGIVGWFYIVGGTPSVVLGAMLLSIVAIMGWKILANISLLSDPVAKTFFLWMVFHVVTEGTIDDMEYMVVVGLMSLLLLELMLRVGHRFIRN